jgi:hypothetical protein
MSTTPIILICGIPGTGKSTFARWIVTSAIHDRMPVILSPDDYDLWLDPGMQDVRAISEFLKPYDAHSMHCYPVSTRVNHVENDDEDCSRRIGVAQTQNSLFAT